MPEGKPHTAVTSKVQSRKLFALANRGEISMADAKGKTRAANFSKLPERKRSAKVKTTGTAYESRRRRPRRSARRA